MHPRICVLGSSNLDLILNTPRVPVAGETMACSGLTTVCGGKGGNQAVMAARLGGQVQFLGRIGNDHFGQQLRDNYLRQGVDVSHLTTDATRPSGVAIILVEPHGENRILLVPGANAGMSVQDVQHATEAITSAQLLVAQLEVPIEATLEAFRIARASHVRTLFNPAPASSVPREMWPLVDWCIPNETELQQLTGLPTESAQQVQLAAESLLQWGVGQVLVTRGARGSLLISPEAVQEIPSPVVQAVDTSGAGDAFIGSLAVDLARGMPLLTSAHRASAIAALSVTRKGTQSSYPSAEEAAAWLAEKVGA